MKCFVIACVLAMSAVLVMSADDAGPVPPAHDAPCADKIAYCKPHKDAIVETFDLGASSGMTPDEVNARACSLKKFYNDCLEWFNYYKKRCESENAAAMGDIHPKMGAAGC